MDSLSESFTGLSIKTEKARNSKSGQGNKSTSYKGKHESSASKLGNNYFEEFECQRCKKGWASVNSYRKTGYQKCNRCFLKVYPQNQMEVLRTLAGLSVKGYNEYKSNSGQGKQNTSILDHNDVEEDEQRYFGEFKCQKCKKTWASAHTYKGFYQKCKRCFSQVYPRNQRELERSGEKKKSSTPHPPELCQKCIQSRRECCSI
ncbi:unnamed protein product [Meganyctiphanes norvegica]|uniref:3CxxC-type domain-containing protein n=1 Tax=Meganyctiphanes norvegica TaxID=48144 RepID=A0AAV2QDP0_MEGNR